MTSRPLRQCAAFLDRDGVINLDRGYVARREDFEFIPGVLEASRKLHEAGFVLVVVTNQSGIGRGLYSETDFGVLTDWMKAQFAAAGAPLAAVYHCPHHPTEANGDYRRKCECRKPAPGMLLRAERELGLDLSRSILFGDQASDLQAALAADIPERVLLGTDGRVQPVTAKVDGLYTAAYRSLIDAVPGLLCPKSKAAGASSR